MMEPPSPSGENVLHIVANVLPTLAIALKTLENVLKTLANFMPTRARQSNNLGNIIPIIWQTV